MLLEEYSGQTKIFTFDGMIYHIIPTDKNGTHEYKNIIYVEKSVYDILITDELLEVKEGWKEIISKSEVEPNILMIKINHYRHKAGKIPIIFA